MIDTVNRLLAPLANRVRNMVSRAVVQVVDDAKKAQLMQLGILADEVKDDVERLQNYGFTSVPLDGAEAVVVFVGGKREHGIVIVTEDRRHRLRNLESGEVAVYDRTGSKIVLKTNGDIEVTPSSGVLKLVGDLNVSGDVACDGTVTGSTDVVGGGKSLKNHTHTVVLGLCTAGGATGTASTSAPA